MISTRQELFAIPGAFFDISLDGERRFTHPALSIAQGFAGSIGS